MERKSRVWSGGAVWVRLSTMSSYDGETDLPCAGDGSWARRSPSWSRPPGQCRLGGGEADLAYYRSTIVFNYVYSHGVKRLTEGPADIDHEVLDEHQGHRKITEGT